MPITIKYDCVSLQDLLEMDAHQMRQLYSFQVSNQLGILLFACIVRKSREQLFGLVNLAER
jgi:hypothetical protein